jgi:hypothetical protein
LSTSLQGTPKQTEPNPRLGFTCCSDGLFPAGGFSALGVVVFLTFCAVAVARAALGRAGAVGVFLLFHKMTLPVLECFYCTGYSGKKQGTHAGRCILVFTPRASITLPRREAAGENALWETSTTPRKFISRYTLTGEVSSYIIICSSIKV